MKMIHFYLLLIATIPLRGGFSDTMRFESLTNMEMTNFLLENVVEVVGMTVADCAKLCHKDPACVSFSYDFLNSVCSGHSQNFATDFGQLQKADKMAYFYSNWCGDPATLYADAYIAQTELKPRYMKDDVVRFQCSSSQIYFNTTCVQVGEWSSPLNICLLELSPIVSAPEEIVAACDGGGYQLGMKDTLCYKVHSREEDHKKAIEKCLKEGARLVNIAGNEKLLFVQSLVQVFKPDCVWINGKNTGNNTWIDGDGNPLEDPGLWKSGEPQSLHGTEECLSLDRSVYMLYIEICTRKCSFVCQKP